MTQRYRAPEPLGREHEVDAFSCRSTEQTDWLRRLARQSASSGTARTFVVRAHDDARVVAYYAWCMAQIRIDDAPARLRRGAGRYPRPVALLARLGVDTGHEGQGLGAGLLIDVVSRMVSLDDSIGCRALLIHAETTGARDFYCHLIPELETSPTDDLHLVLLMKDARRTLRRD